MNEFLKDIRQYPLSENQYLKEETEKKQIVLHHTAGGSDGWLTMQGWNIDSRGRIATCVTISNKSNSKNIKDGEIIQGFSSKYWAYHLGIKPQVFSSRKLPYKNLDRQAIGIELCAWGPLDKVNGKFYNYVDREVLPENVCELDTLYKGFKYYHKYSDKQIQSVENLLLYWNKIYKIDLTYNYDQLFTVNNKALKGENGLFTHNSYRKDKTDIFPQPELLEMLENITKKIK